jgi:hypothetical protein
MHTRPSFILNSGSESESYVTTDGQSASLSWNNAPIWGLRPDFYYCQTVAGLLMWGALSDVRMGLSFTTAAGPRQRSHSQVRVLWDSCPYFTVSGLRLPFSSPPTTRRATVEVLDLEREDLSIWYQSKRLSPSDGLFLRIHLQGNVYTEPLLSSRWLLYSD